MAFAVITHRDDVMAIELPPEVHIPVSDWREQIKEELGEEMLGVNDIQYNEGSSSRYGKHIQEVVFIDINPEAKNTAEEAEQLVKSTVDFIAYIHAQRTDEQLAQMPALQ